MEEEIRVSREEATVNKEQLGQLTIKHAKPKLHIESIRLGRTRDDKNSGRDREVVSPLKGRKLNLEDFNNDRSIEPDDDDC